MLSTVLSVWVNGNGGFYKCPEQALALGLPVSPRNYPTICIIEPLLSYFVMLQRPLESGDNPRFRPPLAVSISVYYVITTPIQCYRLITMLQTEALYTQRGRIDTRGHQSKYTANGIQKYTDQKDYMMRLRPKTKYGNLKIHDQYDENQIKRIELGSDMM